MFFCNRYLSLRPCFTRFFSLTTRSRGLNEFFDAPKNWGSSTVPSGRPWRLDELRRKSSVDLHNLWYVLIKERNMLMTTEEEHWRRLERMPNPERFEKVEESMENLLRVVEERDKAVCELERGAWLGPEVVDGVDKLGRPVKRLTEEHTKPQTPGDDDENAKLWSAWTLRYLRAEREQKIRSNRERARFEKFDTYSRRQQRVDKISEDDSFECTGK